MKTARMLTICVLALGLVFFPAKLAGAEPMGTAFSYQGHLYDVNYAANGLYDFQFKLFDDPNVILGYQLGDDVNKPDVDVIDAYFTVELDFGSGVFDGNAVWLEVGVRPGELDDPNVYTTLSPRQEVTPTPYAIYADSSNWNNLIDVPTDIADGDDVGITSETDPTVLASVKDGISWSEVSSRPAGLDDGDDVGITSETDPTVLASVKDGISWSEVSSRPAGLDDGDDVGITAETDPTVPANLKDGVSWTEVANIPAGFADNVDNTGITSESDTLDTVCSRGSSTSRSVTVNNSVYSNRFYVSDAGNDNGIRIANTSSSYPTAWVKNNGNGTALYGETGNNNAVYAKNTSDYYPTIWARNQHSNAGNSVYARSNSSSYPTLYVQQDGSNWAGWFAGDLGCSGTKSATVETQSYGHRSLYADESAEIYFFDRGRGQLTDGNCIINLDPLFLETVTINDSYPMSVQITLTADCKGVFVAEKTSNSFTVQELQGGTSNATFDWEVAAKRKGYEDIRMEQVTFVKESLVEGVGAAEFGDQGVGSSGGGVRIIRGE